VTKGFQNLTPTLRVDPSLLGKGEELEIGVPRSSNLILS